MKKLCSIFGILILILGTTISWSQSLPYPFNRVKEVALQGEEITSLPGCYSKEAKTEEFIFFAGYCKFNDLIMLVKEDGPHAVVIGVQDSIYFVIFFYEGISVDKQTIDKELAIKEASKVFMEMEGHRKL